MMSWKRPRRGESPPTPTPPPSPTLLPETGAVLARNIREVIGSTGCLMSNVAGLGHALALRLADGDLTESEALAVNERIGALIGAVEALCQDRVGPLVERLAPPQPAAAGHPHPHEGG
jgi:hypothetical protein